MSVGMESLFDLQNMDPILRHALMTQMGLAQGAQRGMDSFMGQMGQDALGAQERQASAETEYASAAGQPPVQEGPGEVTRSLFGNIASAVSGQPQFGQQAQAANARDLQSMMDARKQQLFMLHEKVTQRAATAERLGNQKLAAQQHQLAGNLERALGNIDKLQQSQVELSQKQQVTAQEHKNKMEEIGLSNQGSLNAAKVRANATMGDLNDEVFSKDLHTELDGRKWFDGTTYTGKTLDRARRYASDQGAKLLGKDEAGQIQDINSSIDNIDRLNTVVRPKLPEKWNDPKRLLNMAAAASGADADLAGAAAFFPTKIRALRAEVGRASFRMTQAEINSMERTGPNVGLPRPVWDNRVEAWKGTLNVVKNRILGPTDHRTRFKY